MKKILVATIALAILIFLVIITAPSLQTITKQQAPENANTNSSSVQTERASISQAKFSPDVKTCEQTNISIIKLEKEFLDTTVINWDDYLSEGYSLDSITLAIESIKNKEVAYQWRREQLVADSQFVKQQNQLDEEFEKLSGQKKPAFMTFSPKVPQADLNAFTELNDQQKHDLLSNIDITVDDVAYYIKNKEVTDKDIILLLNRLDDYNELIGYNEREPLHLIDTAAKFSRPKIFEYLLSKGAKITNDAYLTNTLEYSLKALYINKEDPQAATIVKKLLSLDQKIRVDNSNVDDNGVSYLIGNNNGYHFSEEDVREIYNLHDIDLNSVSTRAKLSDSPENTRLKALLISEINDFVTESSNNKDIYSQKKECNKYLADIRQKSTGKHYQEIINEHKKSYGNDYSAIEVSLSEIDPSLVDCFNKQQVSFQPFPMTNNTHEMWRLIREKKYSEAFTIANSLSPNNGQKAHFFWQVMDMDTNAFSILKSNGFVPERISFRRLFSSIRNIKPETIEKFYSEGIDTYFGDSSNISMINYAVASNNIPLVHYLINQGYPYKINELGQDPLHVALINHSRFQINNLVKLIKILKPEDNYIDKHHLSRMYVIKLKYPSMYNEIIKSHPKLTIQDDTKAPESICLF